MSSALLSLFSFTSHKKVPGTTKMLFASYRPLAQDEEFAAESMSGQPVNYGFFSKRDESIKGAYYVNTDLEAPAGRFHDQKERDEASNLHLEARSIDTTIVISGSKPAKITITDEHSSGSPSMFIVRLIRQPEPMTSSAKGKKTQLVHLQLNQTSPGRIVVAMQHSSAFLAFVDGSFKLSEGVLENARCIIERPRQNRWLVVPEGQLPPTLPALASGESTRSSSYRDTSYPPCNVALKPVLGDHLSSISLKGQGEEMRRIVCYGTEFEEQKKRLLRDETFKTAVRYALMAAGISGIVGWILCIFFISKLGGWTWSFAFFSVVLFILVWIAFLVSADTY